MCYIRMVYLYVFCRLFHGAIFFLCIKLKFNVNILV